MKTFAEWIQSYYIKTGFISSDKELMLMAWNASAENSAEEIRECDELRDKLSEILSKTAIALKGPEAELSRHGWHDLPEIAAQQAEEIAKRDERIESLTAAGAEYQRQCFEQAAEISRLKGVISKCSEALLEAQSVRAHLAKWRTRQFRDEHGDQYENMKREFPLMDDIIAAIKEEGL